jgi:hypothetical protein
MFRTFFSAENYGENSAEKVCISKMWGKWEFPKSFFLKFRGKFREKLHSSEKMFEKLAPGVKPV